MLRRLAEGVRQLRLAYCRGLIGETREIRIKVFIVTWCHLLKTHLVDVLMKFGDLARLH
uniref:Tnp_DDE_dom domain-containing protein n=1 Tax=Macrostomum lignano TaxID=282301 RepID=A0A1I8G9Q0_9PLAT